MEIRPIDEADVKRVLRAVKRNRMVCINKETEIALKVAEGGLTGCKTLSLNTLRDAIFEDAVAHGLWETIGGWRWWPHECVEMIQSEVDELFAAKEEWGESTDDDNEHFIEELADVIIMCFSVAGKLGIDIDAAIHRKMEINHNRSWKHEGEHREEPHDPH